MAQLLTLNLKLDQSLQWAKIFCWAKIFKFARILIWKRNRYWSKIFIRAKILIKDHPEIWSKCRTLLVDSLNVHIIYIFQFTYLNLIHLQSDLCAQPGVSTRRISLLPVSIEENGRAGLIKTILFPDIITMTSKPFVT